MNDPAAIAALQAAASGNDKAAYRKFSALNTRWAPLRGAGAGVLGWRRRVAPWMLDALARAATLLLSKA